MVQMNSKSGFFVTYATGRYAVYDNIASVVYAQGNSVFTIIWRDGTIDERETDAYRYIQSLDNDSIIEF